MSAVLLALHPDLAQQARAATAMAGLSQVGVRTVDASRVDAYRVVVRADIVLMVDIFGSTADADVWRFIAFARSCAGPAPRSSGSPPLLIAHVPRR